MLHACPRCQRLFPGDAPGPCPSDGEALRPVAEVPAPTDHGDPLVGFAIADRYEIRRIVAEGSMGRVYEARDLREESRVAVKILHPQVAEESVNIERFRREAETSKQLDGAYIVDVREFASVPRVPGRAKRTWYLIMEYLDGEEVRAILKRESTLSFATVVRITSQVAMALDVAHAAGAVHRDMKPDNIFVVRDGDDVRVKILDFGSVKFTRGQDRGNKLTVLGTTIGSPYYMAPEQAQGDPDLDGRADVWAVTAIVYEMLVGRVPFNGSNGPQILFKILSDEPEPPTFVNEVLPAALDDVIMKGFRKKPADRYQTVGALADALGRALGLQGDHRVWAETSTPELLKQLPGSKAPPTLDTTTDKLVRPSSGPQPQARSVPSTPSPPATPATPDVRTERAKAPVVAPAAPPAPAPVDEAALAAVVPRPNKTPILVAAAVFAVAVVGLVVTLVMR